MADLTITPVGTINQSTVTTGAGSTVSDTGTLAGHYLLVMSSIDFVTPGSNTNPGITAVPGVDSWAEIATPRDPAGTGTTMSARVWLAKVTANGQKTVPTTGASGSRLITQVHTLDPGAGGTITVDDVSIITDRSTPFDHTSLNLSGTKDLLYAFFVAYGGGPTMACTSPLTQVFSTIYGSTAHSTGRQQLSASGATGSRTQTGTGYTGGGGCGAMFALRSQGTASAVVQAAAAVSGGMSMTIGGTVIPAVQGSAAVAGSLAVTAGATTNTTAKASAAVSGTLTVAAGGSLVSRVAAAITGALAVGTAPTGTYGVAADVAAVLTFAAAATPARAAAAVLTGELTTSLSPSRGQPVAAAVSGTLSMGAVPGLAAASTVTGVLDVDLAAKLNQGIALDEPIGRLTFVAEVTSQGYATMANTLTGVLDVSAGAFRDQRDAAAAVTGVLQVTGSGTRVVTPSAAITGVLAVTSTAIRAAAPILTISGALSVEAIAVSSAGGSLNVKLFGIDRQNGGALVPLPHWSKLDVSRQLNGAGSIAVEYPVWGRNFRLLARDVAKDSDLEVEVWLGGRRSSRVTGYLQQPNGDDVAEAATWQFTGVDMCARMDEIIIWPQAVVGVADLGSEVAVPQSTVTTAQWTQLLSLGYTGRNGDSVPTVYAPQKVVTAVKAGATIPVKADDLRELKFNATSPGAVMNIVMSQFRARGGGTDLTMDFTGARDSNGTPWPNLVTAKWSPGTTASSILGRLVELGLIDWEVTSDKVLRMFVQGTSGSLYTSGPSAVRLRRGINLAEATHRASSRENLSAVLAAGSGGLYSDVTNVSAQTRIGRRKEGYTTAGNIVDTDALLNVAQRTASLGAYGPDERTCSIAMGTGHPRPGPGQTFDKADTLLLDTTGTGAWIQARVAQWAISVDPAGATGNVVVGDLISSRAAAILKRLTETDEGSTVVGTSLPSGPDTGIPRAPEGLVVGSYAFAGGSSGADEYATVTAGWQAVVYNTDNTACTDLAGYRVEWRQDGTTAWLFGADVPSGSTQGVWTTACAIPIYVRVRAYDRSGNTSTWTVLTAPHTTDDDTTPPGIPSTPIGGNYLGTVQVSWDGKDSNNADMYAAWPDFKVARLHMSQASEFVPDESTQVDMIYGAGTYTYSKLPSGASLSYGTTYYFKLVSEDQRGNRSAPSGQTSATAGKVVNVDLGPNAVARANIQVAAIGTAQIDNLAVNDAQIGGLGVGKLQAGTLTASMIVGTGKISTRANGTGPGWDGDSAGIRLYSPAGMINVDFRTADGSAMVSGEYRTTNASTARMIINPGGGSPAEMQFYPSSTAQYARIKVLTSVATGFENQAGIAIKGYSPRSDKASGELSAFPSYASIAWANEMDSGTNVQTRIAASAPEAFITGPRVHIGAQSSTAYEDSIIRIGVLNNAGTAYVQYATVKIDNKGTGGMVRIMSDSPNGNSGFQFNDLSTGNQGVSAINENRGLVDLYALRFLNSSDRRLKTNIIRDPIDAVAAIRKAAFYTYTQGDTGARLGLMADELPADVTTTDHNGNQAVDAYAVAATVWGAVRQLIPRIEALEQKGRA